MPEKEQFVKVDLGSLNNACFVIMPFAGAFNTVYERVIRPAVEQIGLACIRADEVFSKPQITHDIWKQIRSCRVVVAELTGRNPNVLYELGLAHAIGKPVVIMTRNEADVPFDLKALRYLFYDIDDPFWGESLKNSLSDMCSKVIGQADFGTVLEGINLPDDVEFQEITQIPTSETSLFDLTGVWQGTIADDRYGKIYTWVLQLVQNGELLNGTAIVSYFDEGDLTVVQQTLSGEINDGNVRFHGLAYSYIQQGQSKEYVLDSFTGTASENGGQIDGQLSDDKRDVGRLVFARQIIGPNA